MHRKYRAAAFGREKTATLYDKDKEHNDQHQNKNNQHPPTLFRKEAERRSIKLKLEKKTVTK